MFDKTASLEIPDSIEVHTAELTKYNLKEEQLESAIDIERWAFFFSNAQDYDSSQLRRLLPANEFQSAIEVVESIAGKSEDRTMYDQREKAHRDYQWLLEGTRQQGVEKGREEGREEGLESGHEAGLENGMLVGKIQLLRELLKLPAGHVDELSNADISELNQILTQLQHQLRTRDKQA